jgi:N-acetylneuraminic acid mutarotase
MSAPIFRISEPPPIPAGRALHAAGVIDGKIVVAGGNSWNDQRTLKHFHSDMVIYHDGAWSPGPELPQPFADGGYACDGKSLFLVGGQPFADGPTAAVSRIFFGSETLRDQPLSPLPNPRSACAAAVCGGRLFVSCGSSSGIFTADLFSLDLASPDLRRDSWRPLAALPGPPRCYPAFTAIGDKLYLFGGLGSDDASSNHALNDAYVYDLAADQWSMLGKFPVAGYCWSAAPVDAHCILLAGRADGVIHPEIYAVDLATLAAQPVGQAVIQATCAPLLQINPTTWWLIAGEPDSKRTRTPRITAITLAAP